MQVQTELQAPFHYSIVPIIVCSIIVALLLALLFIVTRKRPIRQVLKVPKKRELSEIKRDYLNRIAALKSGVAAKRISDRKAFQTLSGLIRSFVFEVTNIKVQNYTLQEIETLKMANLTELIREYYDPEFAMESSGDIAKSIEKTKQVIARWT